MWSAVDRPGRPRRRHRFSSLEDTHDSKPPPPALDSSRWERRRSGFPSSPSKSHFWALERGPGPPILALLQRVVLDTDARSRPLADRRRRCSPFLSRPPQCCSPGCFCTSDTFSRSCSIPSDSGRLNQRSLLWSLPDRPDGPVLHSELLQDSTIMNVRLLPPVINHTGMFVCVCYLRFTLHLHN